jgi:hypothetical protein
VSVRVTRMTMSPGVEAGDAAPFKFE